MKQSLLILSLLFILIKGYSQNSDYKKNEVSVGVINYIESPNHPKEIFKKSYYFVPFSSLTYKRFLNKKSAIRLTYFRPIKDTYDNSGGDWIDKGEYEEQILKIGYELYFNPKRFTPYLGIDLTYLNSLSFIERGGGIVPNWSSLETKIESIGLTPYIGITYNLYKIFYIGLECDLSIMNFKKKTTFDRFSFPSDLEKDVKRDSYIEYILNPIILLAKVKF